MEFDCLCGGGIDTDEGGEKMYNKLKNGYLTEELFVVACMERDIVVSRPITNTEPYDFVVENGDGDLVRVQVKKSWTDEKGRNIVSLKSSYPRSRKKNVASENIRVDYISVFCCGDWYNIPRSELRGIKSNICVSKSGERAKFINDFSFKM